MPQNGGELDSIRWLFENGHELLAVIGADSRFKQVNPAWTRALGWTAPDLIGRSCFSLVHPDDRDHAAAAGVRINQDDLTEANLRVRDAQGAYHWYQGYFQRADSGDLIGVLRDATAEHERRREHEEAKHTRKLLAEAAGIGAWTYEPATDRITFSTEFAAVTGYGVEEIDTAERFLDLIHPDDRRDVKRSFTWGVAEGMHATIEHRMRVANGEWRRFRATFRTVARPGGLYALQGISQNVTELADARDEAEANARRLKQALSEAEAASEAKASFLANMSHEIRTPMNGVLGVLHLLQRERLSPEGKSLLLEALACGQMLSQLLNDVLDFSKIEAGRLEITAEALNPAHLLNGVAGLIRPQADAKGLALIVDDRGWDGFVMADPVRLRQALFNLIGNAVKFTLEGRVTARLTSPGPDRLRFEIEDTGVGISAEAQDNLFQRFSQADASTTRRFGGSGLGLAITQKLAQMMGGDVGVNSQPGQGSTFWIEIEAPRTEAPRATAAIQGAALDGLNVLLVEDNATNRLIASKLLENLGACVSCAEDGESGVDAAATGAFDLVLMDIQMPGIDGLEAARRIRNLPGPASQLPIIALTANVLKHQRAEYLAAGMNGVVGKPISPSELLAEISRLAGDEPETLAASAA